jgi:tetratricopeptide (TPR) repeat protein
MVCADVRRFAAALESADLETAVDLYTGPFLDGFHLKDAPEFERWMEEERDRLRRDYVAALERLAADADSRRDSTAAVKWWKRLAAADPLSARIACGLMNAHVAAADRSAAIQYARVHEAYVRSELGVDPDPAVRALAQRIAEALAATNGVTAAIPVGSPPNEWNVSAHSATDSRVGATPDDLAIVPKRVVHRRRHVVVVAMVAAAILIAGVLGRREARETTDDASRRRVVVARFDDATADTSLRLLGQITADWIADGLTRTGVADVVDPQSARVSTRAADSSDAGGAAWVRAVAENAGARIVVSGGVYREREAIVLRARVTDMRDGTVLRTIDPVRGDASNPMPAVEELRSRVAGALATILDPGVSALTTAASRPPRFDAYRAYVQGLDSFARQRYVPALRLFRESVRLDSTFVLPLFWWEHAAYNSGNVAGQDSIVGVLAARRGELAPAEQHAVDAMVRAARGDREGELESWRKAAALAPGSDFMWMRGRRAAELGYYDEYLESMRAIDPYRGWARGWRPYWIELLGAYHLAGRNKEEVAAARQAERVFPHLSTIKGREMMALVALGDMREALRILDSTSAERYDTLTSGTPGAFYEAALRETAAHGRPADARRVAERCVAWFQRTGPAAVAGSAIDFSRRALCLRYAGRPHEARADYEEMLRRAHKDEPSGRWAILYGYVGLGQLAAERGDAAEVERLIQILPSAATGVDPSRGILRANRESAAMLALLGDRDRAVEHLRDVVRIEGPIDDSHDPALRPIRGYPPYEALRRQRTSEPRDWAARVRRLFALR